MQQPLRDHMLAYAVADIPDTTRLPVLRGGRAVWRLLWSAAVAPRPNLPRTQRNRKKPSTRFRESGIVRGGWQHRHSREP